jgi:hypothetical protein
MYPQLIEIGQQDGKKRRSLFRPVPAVLQCIEMPLRMISGTEADWQGLRCVTRHQDDKSNEKTAS